jgi:hypothetical protein
MLCCVLPVLYVGPLLSLALPAMAAEGLTGSAALSRSAELTRHNPQRRFLTSPLVKILALFLVVTVISYLVNLVLILPATVTQGLSMVRKMAAGEDLQRSLSGLLWWQVPLVCLSSFTTSAVYVYASFALALLFFDLRARRDGDDLRLAIAGMAGTAPGVAEPPAPPAPLPPLGPPPLVPPPGGGGFGGAWPSRPAAPVGQGESTAPAGPARDEPGAPAGGPGGQDRPEAPGGPGGRENPGKPWQGP